MAGALAPFGATCRLCGVACASGTKFCSNCGAIQRPGGTPIEGRARPTEPLPPLPQARAAEGLIAAEAAPAAVASGPTVADVAHPSAMPASPRPSAARGERLVAWSAFGVLLIASIYFVQRLDDLRSRIDAAPVPVTITAPSYDPLPAFDLPAMVMPAGVPDATPGLAPARETIAAARHAAKPASRAKAHASRKPPARAASHPRANAEVAAVDVSPLQPSARPEPMLVATAPANDDARTHWDEMRDEIASCSSRDFLDGVMCQQRVRIRYCEGWWGRAGDCPSRRDDYGN